MNRSAPGPPARWLRLSALFLGLGLLAWLPVEEASERPVLVFAALLAFWGAARLLAGRAAEEGWCWHHLWRRHALVGALGGLAVAPLAVLLMAFKSGLHGHGAPDFTPSQLQSILLRAPYAAASDLLLGLGSALWIRSRRD